MLRHQDRLLLQLQHQLLQDPQPLQVFPDLMNLIG